MSSLAGLCLDLFLLGHAHLAAGQAGEGAAFERRVRRHLNGAGLPDARGFRIFGRRSLSGLYHQLDEQTACKNALVVGEWKAYRGRIPKNDLLRFKAATDDYWFNCAQACTLPVLRVFGGTGAVMEAMRVYAAQWGIILVTPDRWPIPSLVDPDLLWSPDGVPGPAPVDQKCMTSLMTPLNGVFVPHPDGSWRLPPVPTATDVAGRLRVWKHWSDQAWRQWEDVGRGHFGTLMETRLGVDMGSAA